MKLHFHYIACMAIAFCTASSQAQDVDTPWRLRIMDLNHQVKVDATVLFTKEKATESCIGGQWKRVVVERKINADEKFFPLNELLAYDVERGELTLGRTEVCDGYRFLTGKLRSRMISGAYKIVGPGYSEKLGYFSLKKTR